MPKLSFEEVAELLRKIGRGELRAELNGPDWDTQWFSCVNYLVQGGWYLRISLDCGRMDYVECVQSPDGTVTDWKEVWDDERLISPYELIWQSDPELYKQIEEVLRVAGNGRKPLTVHEMDVRNLSPTHDFIDGTWVAKT